MRGKERITKRIEQGILSLVLVLLLLQTILFIRTLLFGPASDAQGLYAQRIAYRKDTLFYFDPNYVTQEELVALGLSPKQAAVVIRWREQGGYFWDKSDFAAMYTVSDSMYRRLEPYLSIRVPLSKKLDLNKADSVALDALPGIGPYYARKILSYRDRLGGYRELEQLMEVGLDSARFVKIKPRLWCDTTRVKRLSLSCTPADSLARHPYVGSYVTSSIVEWRTLHPGPIFMQELVKQGVVSLRTARILEGYWQP